MESKGSRLGNGHAAEHGTSLPGTTGGRSSSEQSRGHLLLPLGIRSRADYLVRSFPGCRCKALALDEIGLSRIGFVVVGGGIDSVEPTTLPFPSRLSERCSCPSLSLLGVNSVACFIVVTFQVQDRNWDAIWPRRCHSEYASSLARSAPSDEARTAGLAEDCQQPKSLFAVWSHDGPLVVGVDGI